MAAFPATSSKSLGKRPSKTPTPSQDPPSPKSDVSSFTLPPTTLAPLLQTRQKRVLPSRSRRGGPGVGGCDVDITILEGLKRQGENDPLIPSTSAFLLTTDSSLIPPPSSSSANISLDALSNERYFDRPEVIKSYKVQQDIQTPEYAQLSDGDIVGGRLRARGEEQSADTSDAAYEKRHRKYETFEKRQRFREKEKLKHEHYKLKERIEQLRGMDNSAFLVLPASSFSSAMQPDVPTGEDTGIANLPGANVNGAAALNEGERRRKKMLDGALALEERYRVLLPAERKILEKPAGRNSIKSFSASVEPDSQVDVDVEEDVEEGDSEVEETVSHVETLTSSRGRKIRLKINLRPSRSSSSKASAADVAPSVTARSERKRGRSSLPPLLTNTPLIRHNVPTAERTVVLQQPSPEQPPYPTNLTFLPYPASISAPPQRAPASFPVMLEANATSPLAPEKSIHATEPTTPEMVRPLVTTDLPLPLQSPKKKLRMSKPNGATSTPVPELKLSVQSHDSGDAPANISIPTSISTPGPVAGEHSTKKHMPAILVAGSRNVDTPDARKTNRHVLAFGVKVPRDIEENREFQIPDWVLDSNYSDGGPGSPVAVTIEMSVEVPKEEMSTTVLDDTSIQSVEVIHVSAPNINGHSTGGLESKEGTTADPPDEAKPNDRPASTTSRNFFI